MTGVQTCALPIFNARCQNGCFSYKAVNAKENEIVKENGNFVTGKRNPELHGMGLKNVKQIVEKYEGYIEVSYDECSFTVVVMIQTDHDTHNLKGNAVKTP